MKRRHPVLHFFSWMRRTIDMICERPDHLQRIAICAAGVVMYPTVWGLIMIVWRGFGDHVALYPQQISILGFALYTAMVLWGLVVVALLGIVKGLRIDGPGGIGLELETTADDPDVDAKTTRDTRLSGGRRRGGDRGEDDAEARDYVGAGDKNAGDCDDAPAGKQGKKPMEVSD